jgi:hypothetical protein
MCSEAICKGGWCGSLTWGDCAASPTVQCHNLEPHVAESVYWEMLNASGAWGALRYGPSPLGPGVSPRGGPFLGVVVVLGKRIVAGSRAGTQLNSVISADGDTFSARIWLDATYEGLQRSSEARGAQ